MHGNSCQVCNNSPMSCLNPCQGLFPYRSYNCFFILSPRLNEPRLLNSYKLVCTQLRQPRRVELGRKPYLAGSPVLTQFRTWNIRLRSSILLWGPLRVIAIILNFLFVNSRSLCSTRRARLHVFKFIDCKSIYLLGLSICSHHNKQIEGLEQSNFKPVDLSANMRKFAFF